MGHKIVQLASTIRRGVQAGFKTADATERIMIRSGWKPGAAKGIGHGIFAGGVGNYFKSSDTLEQDGIPSQKPNGSQTNQQNKARGRFRSNRKRRYAYCKQYRTRNRYSYSGRNR